MSTFGFRSSLIHSRHFNQSGYVLVSLLLVLFLMASIGLVLNREGSMNVLLASQELSKSEANQVALAGANHIIWRATQQNCSGYTDITNASLGDHTYSATISPTSGSPVSVSSTATLADGTVSEIHRQNQIIYQPQQPRETLRIGSSGIGSDTYLNGTAGSEANNYYTSWDLFSANSVSGAEAFTLIRFDLSSLPSDIKVLSARLRLQVENINVVGSDPQLSLHRVLHPWTRESVNYLTSDGSTPWSWPDSYDPTPESTISLTTTTAGVREWDLTLLVDKWVDGSIPNNGFVIVANDSVNSVEIDSDNHWFTPQKPNLLIDYTCECGLYCDNSLPLPNAIAHWKLDETSGTTAEDSVGTNDGTTYGPTWVGGQVDGAANFNGSSDYILVPHDPVLSPSPEMSISAWLNMDVAPEGLYSTQSIVEKGTESLTEEYWFAVWMGELDFGILDGGDFYGFNTTGLDLQAGTWYHAVVSFSDDSDELKFYLNGALINTHELTRGLSPEDKDFRIGTSQFSEHFYGKLDDIRLFDKVLTDDEVKALTTIGGMTPVEWDSVLDEFDAVSFSGDDGTLSWTNNWQEIGENDGQSSGDIRVVSEGDRDYVLQLKDNDNGGEGVEREMDISGCSSAKLGFEYKRSGLDNINDYVAVSVSGDGGGNWDELDRFTGSGSDAAYIPVSYDITSYIANDTQIRFVTSPNMGGSDRVYFDNIVVRLEGCP